MEQNIRNRLKLKSNECSSSNLSLTPIKDLSNADSDYSPVYLACTQESQETIDVLWDWNSPQSKPRINRRPKRIIIHQRSSPKPPQKKPTNINAQNTFDKIRNELLAFQEDLISRPILELDDLELDFYHGNTNNHQAETNLVQQQTTKSLFSKSIEKGPHKKTNNNAYDDDLFDDSLEAEMLLVSQQVEEKLKSHELPETCLLKGVTILQTPAKGQKEKIESPRTITKSLSSNALFNSPIIAPNKSKFDFKCKLQQLRMSDSFDTALEEFDEFDAICAAPKLSVLHDKEEQTFTSCAAGSVANTTTHDIKTQPIRNASPLKFKTKSLSFGDAYERKTNDQLMREEIEKKRLAALAKLRAKKIPTALSDSETSPLKCSPEEIENKRKQALARLEQKKQQELIERNRLEALKKLEMRRKNRKP